MNGGATIPELLGFAPIPFDRQRPYSVQSYRALYVLTEEEAEGAIETYGSHPAIDMHLAQRYIKDADYRRRIDEARGDITYIPPDENTQKVMHRLQETLKKPAPKGAA